MKEILGHRSWNKDEIVEMLVKQKNFTMPNLPHYRYSRVQTICYELSGFGYIKKSGKTDVSINWIPTDFFWEWQESLKGDNPLGFAKYYKLLNPPKPPKILKHICPQYNLEFETVNYKQKFCSKPCKTADKIARGKIYPKKSEAA